MLVPTLPSSPPSSSPSRSRSLLNFFSLKIRPTSPLPSTTSPLPCAAPAKERRDAALRERGLLPPLKQNKDLSRQERDHDRLLPVVQHTAVNIDNPTGVETVTAANLIKKEWEVKNRLVNGGEQDRFNPPSDIDGQDTIRPLTDQQDEFSDSRHAVIPGSMGRSHNSPQGDDALGLLSPTWAPLPHHEAGLAPSSPTILYSPTDTTANHGPNETTLEQVTPIVLLSPVAEELDPNPWTKDVHRRKPSVSESLTSLTTPSLNASSFSAGISLLGTSENSPRIKTSGVRNIPMIVESPIEEGPLPEMSITDATPNLEAQQEPFQEYQDIQTRRKKRSLFGQNPSRRLTVSASLTNMRRSVANALSRTKSSLGVPKRGHTFDASHLPPSPTYPFSSLTRVGGRRSLDASATRLRQPVSPTLHNRASILLETSAIEDEETRRMTEVAFLD
ncbi:hypothetical protein APHAL10511_007409 [Amanita phalloides]|nr:hypothetical protein APHAL10511_007409 [Amanita phalloides]